MLLVIVDLSAAIEPAQAVAQLDGLRFKSGERRLKRLARGGSIADAVLGGSLRVQNASVRADEGAALLVDRRWTTIADFPWVSRVDSEALVSQHTTHVTHRVCVVCESEHGGGGSVRVEWDFASGPRGQDDGAERVDWVLERLGAPLAAGAATTLARMLRRHKRGAAASVKGGSDGDGDGDGGEDALDPAAPA